MKGEKNMADLNKQMERLNAIRDLIKKRSIKDQPTLMKFLKEEYAITTNQPSISRDLNKLGAIKRRYKNMMIYELPENDASKEILRTGVKNVTYNESLIVVDTISGFASAIAEFLDARKDKANILATLAGENVVFVVPASVKNIKDSYKKVREILHFLD